MINTLLGKVANFFEKDFLLASFVPALLFLGSFAVIISCVIRLDLVWPAIEAGTPMQKAAVTACAGLTVVAFSYVLNGLRPLFLRFWTGTLAVGLLGPFWRLREYEFRLQYEALRNGVTSVPVRRGAFEAFRTSVQSRWDATRPGIPPNELVQIEGTTTTLHRSMSAAATAEHLLPIVLAYERYSGNSLSTVYHAVKTTLQQWEHEEAARAGYSLAKLDRFFGTTECIRGTRLGNIVEAYNAYPAKRYGIEGEVFWPHLRDVAARRIENKAALDSLEDKQTLMSFALTMASLAWLGALMALLGGPWLWYASVFWGALSLAGALAGFCFYRLAVVVAEQFGDLVRASFDLFRLDLMEALYRRHPNSHLSEKEQWEELSRLAVYGVTSDFPLRPR